MKFFRREALYGLIFLFAGITCSADNFVHYKQQQSKNFVSYQKSLSNEFSTYKKAQEKGLEEFKKELVQKWKKAEMSTRYKWVEYSKDLEERKSIDYANQIMHFDVHAKNQKEALQKFHSMFNNTVNENLQDAMKHNILEHKIEKYLHKKVPVEHIKIDIIPKKFTKRQKNVLEKEIKTNKIKKYRYKGNFVYSIEIKLPNSMMAQNAMRFQGNIIQSARREKLPISLIYAIIHSESAFNPMARSYIPAFGLMQIVPRSAGIDAYNYLYGYKKMLNSTYLYSPNHNIKIGSAYLHLVYYQYLKKIRNKQSRLYCTIAAYNTGAGNVAKAFTNSHNMNKAAEIINKLSPEEVYTRLLKQLPYTETKNYLKIVNKRRLMYQKIFSKRS